MAETKKPGESLGAATLEKAWSPAIQDRAIDRVMRLMQIPGASGQEAAVAEAIRNELVAAGADPSAIVTDDAHHQTPFPGDTGNLIFQLPGSASARGLPRRLLVSHLDTVPVCVGSQPERRGDTIVSSDPATGLGADNRAGAATILTAALAILEHQLPHPPLTFLWTIQEEVGLHGARLLDLSRLGDPQLAFNWDGGAPHKLTIGATGGYRVQITIRGKAAHAGNAPETGVSALAIAGLAIADLHQRGWHGQIRQGDQQGTSNLGVISGGAATNVVTPEVHVRAEARSHDPEFRQRILTEMEKSFRHAASEVRNTEGECGEVEWQGQLDYESFCLSTDSPCVRIAEQTVRQFAAEPEFAIANGGVDANWLSARGIPTVSMGCGQRHQHMVSESLCVPEYLTACRIALALATDVNS